MLAKDVRLAQLSEQYNVAQFISWDGTGLRQFRVHGADLVETSRTLQNAVAQLLDASSAGRVNIRTFADARSRSHPFVYGLSTVADIVARAEEFIWAGYVCIINETVPLDDGGVSGVLMGELVEFAPGRTPRAVEEAGTAAAPRELAQRLLATVYGVDLAHIRRPDRRVEFSVHPSPVGLRREKILVWEESQAYWRPEGRFGEWTNMFSRHLGDKTYGLVLADALGCHVPHTVAVPRRLPLFAFGRPPGSGERWIRTAPVERAAGKYTTVRGWVDPFHLLMNEDPNGDCIASVLVQDGVQAIYSGAAVGDGSPDGTIVEGVRGYGDKFMKGEMPPTTIPDFIHKSVCEMLTPLAALFGRVRAEWAHDGERAWLLQLRPTGESLLTSEVLREGEASSWVEVDARLPLEDLRRELNAVQQGTGVILVGNVGLTSHKVELLLDTGVPARFRRQTET